MNREILEILAEAPSGAFWRVAFERASPEEKIELFDGIARDRDNLRDWVKDTFGVRAPRWFATETEVQANGLMLSPSSDACRPGSRPEELHYEDLIRFAEAEMRHENLVQFPRQVEEAPPAVQLG